MIHAKGDASNSPAITCKIVCIDMSVPQNRIRPIDERRNDPA
jgi:hypothetical protein